MSEQPIATPYGISVFGSSIVRVVPDVVVISFSVSQVKPKPKDAFQAVREAAQKVQQFLANAQIKDAGSSSINLTEDYRYVNSEHKFFGYRTSVEFRIVVTDLTRVEDLLAGVLDAGANKIRSVDFQTTRLKALRADARHQAILAAREKAEVYARAAGVEVGEVIHIEDVTPDQLRGGEGHVRVEIPLEDDGTTQAFDPSSIIVGGAVRVAYKIRPSTS
jgi:uncharacterized protein